VRGPLKKKNVRGHSANKEMLESELAEQSDVHYSRQKTIQSNLFAPSDHNSVAVADSPRVSLRVSSQWNNVRQSNYISSIN